MFTSIEIETAEGRFTAWYSDKGLARIDFPNDPRPRAEQSGTPDERVRKWHALTAAAVKNAVAGRAPGALPPLDLSVGTDFQQRVWRELGRITRGETLSYAEIAGRVGKPGAARAVGGACGANPVPVLVPCHRVLAANRRIGGFSGGLGWKRKLLSREGVQVAE